MTKEKYSELINGISKPLKVEDAIFQIKYLIMKNDFEKAYHILKIYELPIERILSVNLSENLDSFLTFLKSKV